MFDLNLGRVGLHPRPDYQPGQQAAPLDLVSFGGSLWVCTAPTIDAPADGHPAWMPAAKGGLMRLTSDLTIYVREDGDDANTGLEDSPQGAFKTPQAALDHVARTYHLDMHTLTVRIGSGTFPRFVCPPCRMLTGKLVLQGAGSGTVIQAVDSNAVDLRPESGKCTLRNMTVHVRVTKSSTSTRNGIISYDGCRAELMHIHVRMDQEAVTTGYIYAISCRGGSLNILEGVTLEMNPPTTGGNRLCALEAQEGGIMRMQNNIAVSGAVRYTLRLVNMGYFIRDSNTVCTGSFQTGTRYWIHNSGICHTNGGGEEFFPGISAGILENGGQYFP